MELIRKLDRRLSKNKKYFITYGLFYCIYCKQEVEKPISYKNCISCGCIHIELLKNIEKLLKHGDSKKGKRKRLYNIWLHIKDRCLNPKNDAYHNYGGRGITICPEWINDYIAFKNWALNNGYQESLEIDRIDNNGNYEPINCRWIIRKENKLKQRRIKLSLKKANEIRIKRKEGISCKQLSKDYKIGLRQIYYVINNKQWEQK